MTSATAVLVDASVVLTLYLPDEDDRAIAALLGAEAERGRHARILDLTVYEVGNRLARDATAQDVSATLRELRRIFESVPLEAADADLAAQLADRHDLTFYDASYAAVAQRSELTLVTADRELLRAEVGVTPDEALRRLRS